jgi:hypothetical protein
MAGPTGTTRYADRYRVVRRLGAGGMATVFLAQDERLGRPVALKRLHANSPEDVARRFEREARLGASLNHPNLVSIYDTLTDPEGVLIVMEYVEGTSLYEALRIGPLPREWAFAVLRGVASALDHAHRHGVVHRDVKPANILLSEEGEAKLVDLGIARAAEGATHITQTGTVLGTPVYMAPEQLEGRDLGPATDVYALAAVAFEALSGRRARSGASPLEVAHDMAKKPTPDLREARPEAPAGVAEALAAAMDADPAKRPQTAGELVARLEAGEEDVPPTIAAGAAPVDAAEAPTGAAEAPTDTLGASAAPAEALGAPAPGEGPAATPQAPEMPEADAEAPKVAAEAPEAPPQAPEAPAGRSPSAAGAPAETPPARGRSPLVWGAAAAALLILLGAIGTIAVLSGGGPSADEQRSGRSEAGNGSPGGARGALTPGQTVVAFYERSAAGDYVGAWALAAPPFREQLGGYNSFLQSHGTLESIKVEPAELQLPGSDVAQVAIRSVATHVDGVDRCRGVLNLARGGPSGWVITGANVTCPETTRGG